jgi:hypothetical protein
MIKLTKHDAVFGRGRKKSSIRLGSTYRSLIETHWAPYSTISAHNVKARRAYIYKHIINGVTKKGGRFIVREGEHLRQLFPNKKGDQNEIVRKICRALFNEKTRQKKLNGKKGFQEKLKNAPVADDDTYETEANSTENESETSKNKEDDEDYEEEDEHSSGKLAASLDTGLNGFIPNILETNNANVLDVATTMEANTAGLGWDLQGWYKEHYGGDQHGDNAHDNKDNHQEMMEMLGDIDAFL